MSTRHAIVGIWFLGALKESPLATAERLTTNGVTTIRCMLRKAGLVG